MAVAPPSLVAAMVRRFLWDFGYHDALQAFETDAAGLLKRWQQDQGGGTSQQEPHRQLKDLQAVLGEYATLWKQRTRLRNLSAGNPLVADLVAVVERHADMSHELNHLDAAAAFYDCSKAAAPPGSAAHEVEQHIQSPSDSVSRRAGEVADVGGRTEEGNPERQQQQQRNLSEGERRATATGRPLTHVQPSEPVVAQSRDPIGTQEAAPGEEEQQQRRGQRDAPTEDRGEEPRQEGAPASAALMRGGSAAVRVQQQGPRGADQRVQSGGAAGESSGGGGGKEDRGLKGSERKRRRAGGAQAAVEAQDADMDGGHLCPQGERGRARGRCGEEQRQGDRVGGNRTRDNGAPRQGDGDGEGGGGPRAVDLSKVADAFLATLNYGGQ